MPEIERATKDATFRPQDFGRDYLPIRRADEVLIEDVMWAGFEHGAATPCSGGLNRSAFRRRTRLVHVRVIARVVFRPMPASTANAALSSEIGALADALGRLLRAWPGGHPPFVLKSSGLAECFPEEHQLDAELLIAAPVRHSMVLGIRMLGYRLAALDGRRGMSLAPDEALGAVAMNDRLKMEAIVDSAWHCISRPADRNGAVGGYVESQRLS